MAKRIFDKNHSTGEDKNVLEHFGSTIPFVIRNLARFNARVFVLWASHPFCLYNLKPAFAGTLRLYCSKMSNFLA